MLGHMGRGGWEHSLALSLLKTKTLRPLGGLLSLLGPHVMVLCFKTPEREQEQGDLGPPALVVEMGSKWMVQTSLEK